MAGPKPLSVWMQSFLPQHGLSRLFGYFANSKSKWIKDFLIYNAIKKYNIDLSECEISDPEEFKSFNDFFTRKLIPEVRPVDHSLTAFCSPVDGTISSLGDYTQGSIFQAKSNYFSVNQLLGKEQANDPFTDPFFEGQYINIYLAPHNYHRIHMPFPGRLVAMRYIPGRLFSVNPLTCKHIKDLFCQNERLVLFFETEFGPMAMIYVGALICASISTPWAGTVVPNKTPKNIEYQNTLSFSKGDECGSFHFGSTVIIVLPKNTLTFSRSLQPQSTVKMGIVLGELQR